MSTSENFNDDELVAPEWLNNDFLQKVIENYEKTKDVEVSNFKLTPGTVKGDHYASVMFRANVDYNLKGSQKTKSVIIKTMPEVEGQKKELLKETHVFETEIKIYTEILPKFETVLRSIGDDTKIGPNCLHYSLHPKKCIVFEDLVPLGYAVQRDRDLEMDEIKEVMRKLAVFHAISYYLNKKEPKLFDNIQHGVMNEPSIRDNSFVTDGIEIFIEILNEVPTLRIYKKYFEVLQKDIFEKCRQTFDEFRENPQSDGIYVLCHGDFHFKNLMLKNNPINEQVEDILLLDFQFCYIGPIVNDLYNAFFMMISREQRLHHFDELLYLYYSHFKSTLNKTDFDGVVPKLSEIRAMFLKHKHFELFMLSSLLAMRYEFLKKDIDLEKMIMSKEHRKTQFMNKEFLDELHQLLPKYLHSGYFEDLL
ncbi:uncharacterized protein LOC119678997 [Teleopsis dalmanni]|uniref:uncharacterized protein LOC119678997 n=1 Tax=Teleopsis dalmanni TaxID=139649 RepID=UPI0018CF41B1|nr:uncharacterized protein LOC119678997 [Teleopsis dalmanni]